MFSGHIFPQQAYYIMKFIQNLCPLCPHTLISNHHATGKTHWLRYCHCSKLCSHTLYILLQDIYLMLYKNTLPSYINCSTSRQWSVIQCYKEMSYQAIKRYGRNLNVYYCVKEANQKVTYYIISTT